MKNMLSLRAGFLAVCLASTSHAQLQVDNLDRSAVANFYRTVYLASEDIPTGWTGDEATCDPGTVTVAYREATLLRFNYFRTLVGLNEVTEDPVRTEKCQQLALYVLRNAGTFIPPPTDLPCYTQDVDEAAGRAIQSIHVWGPPAIDLLIEDPVFSGILGHRRWMYSARLGATGLGIVDGAGATWVIASDRPAPSPAPVVAWPSAGFFPVQHYPEFWSLTIYGADFSQTAVVATMDGQPVDVEVYQLPRFYGDDSVAWRLTGVGPNLPLTEDFTVDVQVSGVVVDGVSRTFDYTVTVFDPEADVSTSAEGPPVPREPTLAVSPNPFNPRTTISFDLNRGGPVRLEVFGVDGRLVATLLDRRLDPGPVEVTWNGSSADGSLVSSGVYLCRLTTEDGVSATRMTLIK